MRPLRFSPVAIRSAALAGLVSLLLLACAPATMAPQVRESSLHIFGGSRVEASDPLSGATVSLIRSNGFPFCTGSYMGGNTVLTAAHCVTGLESPLVFVSFDLETPTSLDPLYGDRGAQSVKSRRVTKTLVHKGYDPARVSKKYVTHEPEEPINDVALVFFEGSAPEGSRAVRLIDPQVEVEPGTTITLAGFGHSDAGGGDYGRLYKVHTHVGGIRNTSLEIVDGPNVEKGSCLGDSGGPVIVGSTQPGSVEPVLTVTGIVSYGPSDCETGTGINTDLRFFRDWVTQNKDAPSLQEAHDAHLIDLSLFVPTAKGSFFQLCQDRAAHPKSRHTFDILLEKLGESDCLAAAEKALRVRELDLSHSDLNDISPLSHFVALERLNLSFNSIQELAPISSLIALQELNLEKAGVKWEDEKHPALANPWKARAVAAAMRAAPYSPGIWLSALKNLKVLKTSGPGTPNLTPRYAGVSQ